MNYTVSSYPQGTFSWVDVASTDMPATKVFLEKLFGWTSVDMPTEPGKPDYTMFYLDGQEVAGGAPTFMPSLPSFWSNFISVDDIDAMVTKAQALGAKILMPAMDVFDSGRMASIQDPTGAAVSFWQARKHIGAHVVNKVGAMCWNELYTADAVKAQEFFGQLLGWTFNTDETGYVTIMNQGRSNGGIFTITPEMAQMPPCWMPYFTVKNLAESVTKVKELGGRVYMDSKDISVGKIATVTDPTGAGMILIEMSVEPEAWPE